MPLEFTEGTSTGLGLSLVAAITMATLFVLEFRSFMKVSTVTDLVMDPGGGDGNDMYIAFKMSMPELVRRDREPMSLCSLPFADNVPAASQVCQFASVEVSDMMGTERQNIHKDMQMTHVRWADRASCAHHRGSTSG